ncbi:hypothetical protein [Bradyrhizobium sp. YR681]|uniref:hypothetical protein n=1 Tax=Bradyrhizobium sp. YR681 TaxID=1144344 RepID=UPI0012F6858C|nr:hypothetical protein [Bradyrhizobium sp. YR681]
MSQAAASLIGIAILLLVGCSTIAPEMRTNGIGVELHSMPAEDGFRASLGSCAVAGDPNLGRYVAETRSGADSWFQVVRNIDQCNLDAARYYTSAETLSLITRPLDELARIGTPECRQESISLRARIVATNAEIRHLVGTFSSLCQVTDSLADNELQKARFNQRREDICQRIDLVLGGAKRGRC